MRGEERVEERSIERVREAREQQSQQQGGQACVPVGIEREKRKRESGRKR